MLWGCRQHHARREQAVVILLAHWLELKPVSVLAKTLNVNDVLEPNVCCKYKR